MSSKSKLLNIGIPKEVKSGEVRVALSPQAVKKLCGEKIPVFVEKSAGVGCGFTDRMYINAGAEILETSSDIWKNSDVIVKVKEPQPEEFDFIKKKHTVFSFLHLSSHDESHLVKTFMKSKAAAIAFETVGSEEGTPLLKPMSVIAGKLAGYFAIYCASKLKIRAGEVVYPKTYKKDLEKLASDFPKIKYPKFEGNVLILGGGTVGYEAAMDFANTKAHIWITEKNLVRQKELKQLVQKQKINMIVVDAQDRSVTSLYDKADIVIGSVYLLGRRAPVLIDEDAVSRYVEKRKVIVDVAVDQGGNVFGTHPTTYDDPVYIDSYGNLRFGVTNIPTLCPQYATKALEKISLPYVLALSQGLESAFKQYPELKTGLNVSNGRILCVEVAKAHNMLHEGS